MVITISDSSSKIYIPVLPEKINYSSATNFFEYDILNKGPVKHPNGSELTSIKWESFFPGDKLADYPLVSKKSGLKASEIHKKIESWRKNGTKLKLNITGTPFSNISVYIDSYDASVQDAHGSIYYEISFLEAIDITVSVTKSKSVSRPGGSSGGSGGTYVVKSGDCLWNISKKLYGDATQWTKIYDANSGAIESTAQNRGMSSSANGHWIFPGEVLTIP